jgi:hypothetical protein
MKVLMHALAASCDELRARTGKPPLVSKFGTFWQSNENEQLSKLASLFPLVICHSLKMFAHLVDRRVDPGSEISSDEESQF